MANATAAVRTEEAQPEWLATLNRYRAADGLAFVSQDAALSKADASHARYLVKNRISFAAGAGMHDENKSNRWYSSAGYWAGHSGNVVLATGQLSQAAAIEGWISAPFHGLAMMAPDLTTSGFGSYCEAGVCAAVLSTGHLSDLRSVAKVKTRERFDYDSDAPEKADQVLLETPVRWPAPGITIASGRFNGREWPDPLSACSGYRPPTGAIVFASFGRDLPIDPQQQSLICNGVPIDHCLVTAGTYSSPDAAQQAHAREALAHEAAVLLIPRYPLQAGTTCVVSITVEGDESQWKFSVSSQPARTNHDIAP